MKFFFLFCFLYTSGFKFSHGENTTTTSRSFIQGAKTVLSSAANAIQKGIEKVPGLENLVFPGCVEAPVICPNENITFWYYSNRSYPDNGVRISESKDSFLNLPQNSPSPWKVIIHGYTKSKDEIPNPELRSAYFRRGDYNLISVDYSPLAKSKCYLQSVNNVPLIAKCTSRFLDKLMDEGFLKPDNLHIIGFSLGAQIASLIHDYSKYGKPHRVTGLDPASPLFDGVVHHRLTEEAGQFVDVIHTNALVKGQIIPSGHVDFYVNGGFNQPGCLLERNESLSTCNHDRSPMYFAESINSQEGFWGIPCSNYGKFLTGACNTEESNLVLMGEDIPYNARGLYFLQTTKEPPFALGKKVAAKLI